MMIPCFVTIVHDGHRMLLPFPPPTAFSAAPQITPHHRPFLGNRHFRRRHALQLLSFTHHGDVQHPEQRPGFRPPQPLEDDGHVVDVVSLQDLFDSGALQIAKRPSDYADRRSDGYTEPFEVYVLGTSHVSEKSAADVQRVLRAVRPQSVVVELCKSRAGLMMPVAADDKVGSPLAMSGDGFAAALARSIRIGGQSTALIRAALAWATQGSMGNDASGRKPAVAMYGDFRAAMEGAEEAEAQIVLGDRPVEVTLQRAWEALSLRERLDLGRSLVQLAFQRAGMGGSDGSDGSGGEEGAGKGGGAEGGANTAAEQLLRRSVTAGAVDEDTLEALIAMLAERFPSVVGPLIYERDLYLAWTLKRSRAVCGQRRVVGVIGRGHLAGVMRAIEADLGGDTLVFKELAGSRGGGQGGGASAGGNRDLERGRALAKFAARIAAETAAGFALWELYKMVASA